MNDGVNAPLRQVPFEVRNKERIASRRYYDEEFYRRECEQLWPHVWQMACRLEQISNVGDWVEYSNLGKSVIVVRTRDGVRAFHNACRHRGVQLASGHGNCKAAGFICPFHGWRWNSEGKNTFVYGRHMFSEAALDEADLALRPCRVELWGGCAFINFDDKAAALRDCIGPLAERLDQYQTDKLRSEWWYGTVIPANWKVAMEAFMEGYHVMRTHPQLQKAVPSLYNSMYGHDTGGIGQVASPNLTVRENIQQQFDQMELLSEGMAGMCHAKDVATARALLNIDLPENPNEAVMAWYGRLNHEVTQQGRARGEPTPDLNALAVTHPVKAVEFIFPNYFLLPFLSSMASYRIRPLGPESCLFELWSLTLFPEGMEPQPPMEPLMMPYDSDKFPPIPRQDYSNIPRQQIGLQAEGFEFMRLSKDIEGLISNYQQLIDGYLRGSEPQKLCQGMAALGSNFDGPIKDLGL
jgi:phenylpropionate dioxygenase-like ring-hydroxylating dioxygenase large terminal subunit